MIVGLIRFVLGLVVGVMLYLPLTLIPIFGPLFTGYTASRIAKIGITRSIILGFLVSGIGFMAWIFYIYPKISGMFGSTLSLVFLWVFVVWNITSIIFTVGGAIFAGIQMTAEKIKIHANDSFEQPTGMNTECDICETFIVCPSCGSACPQDAVKCHFCGADLKHD